MDSTKTCLSFFDSLGASLSVAKEPPPFFTSFWASPESREKGSSAGSSVLKTIA
jgi:hypothetical protein